MSNVSEQLIVLFSARYLPNMGGVEFFTANLGHYLARHGYQVLVVTSEPTDALEADAKQNVGEGSLEVFRLNSYGPARMPFIKRDGRLRTLRSRLEATKHFYALINTRFYDLSRIAAKLCQHCHVKPVLLDHGTDYIQFSSAVLSRISVAAEHLITARLKQYPIDYYGVSRDASTWLKTFAISSCGEIHNALNAQEFIEAANAREFRQELALTQDACCVTFASRLLPEKGADTMLEVARELNSRSDLTDRRPIHICIAGSGPLEDEITQAAKELNNLSYLGKLSHPDMARLLLESDVFCFPSRYGEGLPTALLEAGACNCALVSSRVGGVDEIIVSDEQGIILSDSTSAEVVCALQELADNPLLLEQLQHEAHKHICEHFTWDSTVSEVLAAFTHTSC